MMTRTTIHPLKIAAGVGAALLLWGLLLAYTSSPAQAATITVNSLADDADGANGVCTLREAITSANTDAVSGDAAGECADGSGDDVVDIGVSGTVNLTGALPELSSDIDLKGPGADKLTVRRDTGGNYRIFTVTGTDVSISGMTIFNGQAPTEAGVYSGGGIANAGTLTVSNSTIAGNSAYYGGGMANSGTLTVSNSTLSGNNADAAGGGMWIG